MLLKNENLDEKVVEKKIIFVISNEAWGDMWFSKHHYANELSILGHKVYFVNPSPRWQLKNLFSKKIKVTKIKSNLFTINYKNNFPVFIFPKLFLFLNDQINLIKLNKLFGNNDNVLWWKFDCFRFAWNNMLTKQHFKIYHVVDPYMKTGLDSTLIKTSNLIICANKLVYDIYFSKSNKKVIYLPHAFNLENIKTDNKKVEHFKLLYNNFILLLGTITEQIDFEILKQILKQGYNLVISGNFFSNNDKTKQDWNEILSYKNLFYINETNYHDTQNLIAAAEICIVVYLNNLNNQYRAPLKILDYIKQNKKIITTIKTELKYFKGNLIYEVENKDEFCEKLNFLIKKENTNVDIEKIKKYIEFNSYSIYIGKIFKICN